MSVRAVIELSGHIIDSMVLPRVMDSVMDMGATFHVEEFRVGTRLDESSFARLTIEAELGRRLPDDFETQVKQATLQFYAGDLRAVSHVGEAIAASGLDRSELFVTTKLGNPDHGRDEAPAAFERRKPVPVPRVKLVVEADEAKRELAVKTDEDALPKVARPVNHEELETEKRLVEAFPKVALPVKVEVP